ncbi:hypothetical protein Q1695_006174 [Nippostrongylus brasiliensis]|nr:hypothetical protein Q1695_006174 [Nippostrongylus brasiliensis]
MLAAFLLSALATASVQSLGRQKRQGFYYICGLYPDQYYSFYPCNNFLPSPFCSNGGVSIGVRCVTDSQCARYTTSAAVCIAGCCCTSDTPTTQSTTTDISGYGYCWNGERSVMRCSSTMECSNGQTCMNGLCCRTTGDEWQNACAGMTALASCMNGTCGSFACTSSNYCCECQFGRTSGPCRNGGLCGSGFNCSSNDYCCPSCPNGDSPYGSCYNGLCPSGYTCRSGNICCS